MTQGVIKLFVREEAVACLAAAAALLLMLLQELLSQGHQLTWLHIQVLQLQGLLANATQPGPGLQAWHLI